MTITEQEGDTYEWIRRELTTIDQEQRENGELLNI